MNLEDSEGEEEAPIKWRDYEIETLIAIRGEMDQKTWGPKHSLIDLTSGPNVEDQCLKLGGVFFLSWDCHIRITTFFFPYFGP